MPKNLPASPPVAPATRRTAGSRASDPSGENLPPAHPKYRKPIDRLRRRYPAKKRGKVTAEEQEGLVATTLENMEKRTPAQIGVLVGRGVDSRPVKEVIRTAKEKMQRQVEDYVDLHLAATQVAAEKGNARPAQWALEHIAEGNVRVVEGVKGGGGSSRTLKIGIALGGVPQQGNPAIPAVVELNPLVERNPVIDVE